MAGHSDLDQSIPGTEIRERRTALTNAVTNFANRCSTAVCYIRLNP